MTKDRLSGKKIERAAAVAASRIDRSLPTGIREDNLRANRQNRIEELRRQYLSGTYYVPASEISAALIEKHLKR